MINNIIFSKDRACQLDLFLRSYKTFYKNWDQTNTIVIYTSSDPFFEQGYAVCTEEHPDVIWVEEKTESFKMSVMRSLNPSREYTSFFVDDNVFVQPFSTEDAPFVRFSEDPNILCLSLRMHPGITYCYTEQREVERPQFIEDYVWNWHSNPRQGDWSYPMSTDGNIFRTAVLVPLVNNIMYSNPNTMEGAFAGRPIPIPYMNCYSEPRLVNIPANKVQTVNGNISMGLNSAELNQDYLSGKRIDLEPFKGLKTASPHTERDYTFI